jgi:hypothetical protein
VETITVAADRIPTSHTPGMAVFIGIAFVVIAIAWMALSRRQRQPRV